LLAAEITATAQCDPAEAYRGLTNRFGNPVYRRVDSPATPAQKKQFANLSASKIRSSELAGDAIERVLTRAPFRDAPFGGVKVITAQGWFAARPSGTEDVYKIYAESFRDDTHLQRIVEEAQAIVGTALSD
jgi:phosphoglucomutase